MFRRRPSAVELKRHLLILHGSVYADEVTEVKREGSWHQVTDQPKNAFKL